MGFFVDGHWALWLFVQVLYCGISVETRTPAEIAIRLPSKPHLPNDADMVEQLVFIALCGLPVVFLPAF